MDTTFNYVWKRTYRDMTSTCIERRIKMTESHLRTLTLRDREWQVSNDELRTALEALLKCDKKKLAKRHEEHRPLDLKTPHRDHMVVNTTGW